MSTKDYDLIPNRDEILARLCHDPGYAWDLDDETLWPMLGYAQSVQDQTAYEVLFEVEVQRGFAAEHVRKGIWDDNDLKLLRMTEAEAREYQRQRRIEALAQHDPADLRAALQLREAFSRDDDLRRHWQRARDTNEHPMATGLPDDQWQAWQANRFRVTNRYFLRPHAATREYTGYLGDAEEAITIEVPASCDWQPGQEVNLTGIEVKTVKS
jgi:hypothetical protein